MAVIRPSAARRSRRHLVGGGVVVAAALAAAAPAGAIDFDRLIGIMQPIPAAVAVPTRLLAEPTGIDCYVLPCPYWQVADPDGTVSVGVEAVTAAPDDYAIETESALYDAVVAADYAAVPVIGYVVDRPRAQGTPATQRVLVVIEWPVDVIRP
ncbi:MAG: hypothetical protein R3F55_14710 [Alphaproteobacteria bacterium]